MAPPNPTASLGASSYPADGNWIPWGGGVRLSFTCNWTHGVTGQSEVSHGGVVILRKLEGSHGEGGRVWQSRESQRQRRKQDVA